jgi:membrane-associated protease RseP (regulator of RpoE activity)
VRGSLEQDRGSRLRTALTVGLVLAGVVALASARPRLAGTLGILAAIIAMIMLHELGHFVMAKRAGMKVTEFFLGFGPRLWSTRRGETEYGVKAIPAGGYVRIIGMSNVEEVDPADEERTYRAKPYRHRLGVAVAGSAMHFILATVLLFVVYAAVGLPAARPVVEQIVEDSPAAASDFRIGDRIVAINGQPVREWEDVPRFVESHGETPLTFTVKRGTEQIDIPLTPRAMEQGGKKVPKVGIGAQQYLDKMPIPSAIGNTLTDMPRFTWATLKALGGIFSPAGVSNWFNLVTGSEKGDDNGRLLSPVGAARVAGQAVDSGWGAVLMFLVAINLFVGIFNMVPLLPLDGGHVAIATYEKIASMVKGRRVQVDVARLLPITAAVVAVIVFIGLSALYIDIVRPVPGP